MKVIHMCFFFWESLLIRRRQTRKMLIKGKVIDWFLFNRPFVVSRMPPWFIITLSAVVLSPIIIFYISSVWFTTCWVTIDSPTSGCCIICITCAAWSTIITIQMVFLSSVVLIPGLLRSPQPIIIIFEWFLLIIRVLCGIKLGIINDCSTSLISRMNIFTNSLI